MFFICSDLKNTILILLYYNNNNNNKYKLYFILQNDMIIEIVTLLWFW